MLHWETLIDNDFHDMVLPVTLYPVLIVHQWENMWHWSNSITCFLLFLFLFFFSFCILNLATLKGVFDSIYNVCFRLNPPRCVQLAHFNLQEFLMAQMFLLPQRKKRKQLQIVSQETDSSVNQQRITAVTECYDVQKESQRKKKKMIIASGETKSFWSLITSRAWQEDVLVFDLPTINVIHWILQEKRLQGWELSHPGPTVSLGNFPNSTTVYIQFQRVLYKQIQGKWSSCKIITLYIQTDSWIFQ